MSGSTAHTGRSRSRATRFSVRAADRLSRICISVAGIGTIAAVLLVCVFLVWVALPLFLPATAQEKRAIPAPGGGVAPIACGVDEYRILGWALFPDGVLHAFRLDTGAAIERRDPFGGVPPTAWSFAGGGEDVAFGFADGRIRLGRIGFSVSFLPEDEIPEGAGDLEPGGILQVPGGVVTMTPIGQLRSHRLAAALGEPLDAMSASPIVRIAHAMRSTGPIIAALSADGTFRIASTREQENLLTGEVTTKVSTAELAYRARDEAPAYLMVSSLGHTVCLAWPDGALERFAIGDLSRPILAEEVDLLRGSGARLTSLAHLIGGSTMLAGDSRGRLRAWFPIRPARAETPDRTVLVCAHEFEGPESPATSIATSTRIRAAAVGYADGRIRIVHITTGRLLLELRAGDEGPVSAIAFAPKGDGLIAVTPKKIHRWDIDAKHPEASLGALFGRVWYEGYERPGYVWQTSGIDETFEPKFSLLPLAFGTIKAAFYSLLFAVPIGLLAAIYTSEFLHPRWKARVKPTVEMMASLPSVVLGFLGGIVIAPFVETVVPSIIAATATIPLAILLGAHLRQLLPPRIALRADRLRPLLIGVLIPIGLATAYAAGPIIERRLFAGDLKRWLDGQIGGPAGGWFVLFLPASAVATIIGMGRWIGPWMREAALRLSRIQVAILDLGRFAAGCIVASIGAAAAASIFGSLGFDPRGTFVGTYIQRNALVVGFAMGFAIVPIIYTIAEDALSTIPEHLRSGSLAAGATPWQTATRIVIPTAMSGLFSAVMIGMGRAVGETMIVLMAAGNTPIIDLNIFNGFRTLSANIAVELPEAVRNSTHYRTLFLAGLLLFAMTAAINTAAEIVRLRFRRRAFQL